LISKLKKEEKYNQLISIRPDYTFKKEINLVRTLFSLSYSLFIGIHPVWYHKKLSFMYLKEPRDRIARVISQFEINLLEEDNKKSNAPVHYFLRPIINSREAKRDLLLIFSDRQLEAWRYSISVDDFEQRLKDFIAVLIQHYKDCRFICKPHPLDRGEVIAGLKSPLIEVYKGGLTSQMYIDSLIPRIKACYSVSSTSLLYSASLGIPSYTFYKYLGFSGEYPKAFFENNRISQTPFLYNINNINEIGIIDSLRIEPVEDNFINDLSEVFRTNQSHERFISSSA
jgi:hypothetical protein